MLSVMCMSINVQFVHPKVQSVFKYGVNLFYGSTDGNLLCFVSHMQIITKLVDAVKKPRTHVAFLLFFRASFVLLWSL